MSEDHPGNVGRPEGQYGFTRDAERRRQARWRECASCGKKINPNKRFSHGLVWAEGNDVFSPSDTTVVCDKCMKKTPPYKDPPLKHYNKGNPGREGLYEHSFYDGESGADEYDSTKRKSNYE
tara:strand:+ start:1082 stop:1447 length:366 start_codon:yes stop_codon:yes gene_type:complete